jgi:hypothetical protein
VVQSELLQNCGVQVAVVMRICHCLVAKFVGSSVDRAAFDSAAGQP